MRDVSDYVCFRYIKYMLISSQLSLSCSESFTHWTRHKNATFLDVKCRNKTLPITHDTDSRQKHSLKGLAQRRSHFLKKELKYRWFHKYFRMSLVQFEALLQMCSVIWEEHQLVHHDRMMRWFKAQKFGRIGLNLENKRGTFSQCDICILCDKKSCPKEQFEYTFCANSLHKIKHPVCKGLQRLPQFCIWDSSYKYV